MLINEDCLNAIQTLPDDSVNLVLTSPPYAEQRRNYYSGISEVDYTAWMVSVMEQLKPKLTSHASVLIVIRSHVHAGNVSDYVLRTRLAIKDAGWIEPEELMWLKTDAPPLGSIYNPRRTWEHILWYAKQPNPYVDLYASGSKSKSIGFDGSKRIPGVIGGYTHKTLGVSRVTDVLDCHVGDMDNDVLHPAMYPPSLCRKLIATFSREGDVILDPFAGSGTTLLVARELNRQYIGIEKDETYYKLIKKRLAEDYRYVPIRGSLEEVFV